MTMKRLICLLIILFGVARIAAAQSQTTVTATVVDPNGVPYGDATLKATLSPPGVQSPCVFTGSNCVPIQGTVGPVSLDSTGSFTLNLYPNASITPALTQWTFTVCISPGVVPPLGTGPQCFSFTATIAGLSQDLSATLSAAAPALAHITGGGGGGFTAGGDLSGTGISQNVIGFHFGATRIPLSATAPSTGQSLGFNGTSIVGLPSLLGLNNTWTALNEFQQVLTVDDDIVSQNTIPATAGANSSSTAIGVLGNFFNGAASEPEDFSMQMVFGTGNNPSATANFVFNFRNLNVGTTGALGVSYSSINPTSPVFLSASGPVNSAQGFSIGNAAPLNHCLVGNGTLYTDAACPGGGFANPMTTAGDMIAGAAAGVATRVPGGLTGQTIVAQNATLPVFASPGLAWGNAGAAVASTPYAVLCDSGTAVQDRSTTIDFQTGASVINLPDPTAAGCAGNFVVSLYDDGAGTLTVNRGGAATLNVLDGLTDTQGVTSFTLSAGQTATLNANAAGTIWLVKISKRTNLGTLYSWNAQSQTVAASSTLFGPLSGSSSGNASSTTRAGPITVACTAGTGEAVTNSAQSALNSLVLTLFDVTTTVATGFSITIPAGAASGKFNSAGSATITAGDLYAWQMVNNAAATSAQIIGVGFQCN